MKHQHVDETLTQSERAAPFQAGDMDYTPLEGPLRLAVVYDGSRYAEIDPQTGYCLTVGEVH